MPSYAPYLPRLVRNWSRGGSADVRQLAEYELALTLRAIAETSGVDDGRATEILDRLGVVSTPSVPLP